jgi:type II secretory pathway predicted ATPase ExeA
VGSSTPQCRVAGRCEVGAGKSTAVRALYDLVDRTQHQFVYVADSELTPRSFYRDVLGQLGIPAPFHNREALAKVHSRLSSVQSKAQVRWLKSCHRS